MDFLTKVTLLKAQEKNLETASKSVLITIKGIDRDKLRIDSAEIYEEGSYTIFKQISIGSEVKKYDIVYNKINIVREVRIPTKDIKKIEIVELIED